MTHAALLLVLAEGLLTIMDGIIKGLAQRYPTLQIAGLRFGFGFVWAAALVAVLRPGWPTLETVKANAVRSALSVATATLFFYALGQLPLAEVFALSFIAPIFMVLLGVIVLGEQLEGRIAAGLVTGLVGLALIVWHRIGAEIYAPDALLGAVAVIVSALLYAATSILLRARATRDHAAWIVCVQPMLPALVLMPSAVPGWTPVAQMDLMIFVGIGLLGTIGHFVLAHAFARAEAARLAPLHYVTLVWGVLIGYVFYSEIPSLMVLAGAALIIAGALATSWK
ncbi:MAG TPA: DMT family transporter [Hyphomicrobiaceae bacterium]|nr:DMT family transporter [Hyphomicrobiaceae bacterium]